MKALPIKITYVRCIVACALCVYISACNQANENDVTIEQVSNESEFFTSVMNAAPFLPADRSTRSEGCELRTVSSDLYKNAEQANYAQADWESRIAHSPVYFESSIEQGRILLIDFARQKQSQDSENAQESLAYRYLSNDNSHTQLYEPWSSSKIFAYTGAIAQMRKQGMGAQAIVGDTYVADMITGINSYENFGSASGESNALATFFANLAGRDYLTSLFYDEWLKLSHSGNFFRGAYGPTAFVPSSYYWKMLKGEALDGSQASSSTISPYEQAQDDPGYLPYRCDNCGLTGNKPMTTLAQAEWLKRLATHSREPDTAHPMLTQSDVNTLFYGDGNSYDDKRVGGMMPGISTMLHHALADAVRSQNETAFSNTATPKDILDEVSDGKWRVFQKIGWGPSETRSTTENVVLAHVCLPGFQGGREFTIAAQVFVDEAKEENLSQAGTKMQALLSKSLSKLLSDEDLK